MIDGSLASDENFVPNCLIWFFFYFKLDVKSVYQTLGAFLCILITTYMYVKEWLLL